MLSKLILTTIAYYDSLDYPLTAFEIWKYLTKAGDYAEKESFSLKEVLDCLKKGEGIRGLIEEEKGFYFIKGKSYLVSKRLARNKITEEKYKIIIQVASWLRLVPFVRMVGVTGRVAMKNASRKSDLDFFVVVEKERLFTGRTLVTLLVHLLGKRRHGKKIRDRVCLNYFVASDSLEIFLKDLFASSEYSCLLPIFGFETFQKFQSQNGWIKSYKPHFENDEIGNAKLLRENFFIMTIRGIFEKILDFGFIEKWLEKWQTRRIQKDPRTHQQGALVMANQEMLVFLPNPQGPRIFEKFQKTLANLRQN